MGPQQEVSECGRCRCGSAGDESGNFVGATPTGSTDTVAERRGARLQSALRRFESARCLFYPLLDVDQMLSLLSVA